MKEGKVLIGKLSEASIAIAPRIHKLLHDRLNKPREKGLLSESFYVTAHDNEEKLVQEKRKFHDDADISTHPSYNIVNVSYHLHCFARYLESKDKYNNQFMSDVRNLISGKTNVCEEYFTRSFLSYSTLWPPLHTKFEIDYFLKRFFQLKPKEKKRLNYLMKTNMSLGH